MKKILDKSITTVIDFSVRAARDIVTLDKSDWQRFGKLCLSKEWGEKERIAAIKAVKASERSRYFRDILLLKKDVVMPPSLIRHKAINS